MKLIKALLFALRIYFLTAIRNWYFWGLVILLLGIILALALDGCSTIQIPPPKECEKHCYHFFNYGNTSIQALSNCLNECRTK